MRVVIELDGIPVEITKVNSGGAFPYLKDVGELRTAARAGPVVGIVGTESASVPVTFEKCPESAKLIGQPLRAYTEIFDDAEAMFFAGYVSSIEYAAAITAEVGA